MFAEAGVTLDRLAGGSVESAEDAVLRAMLEKQAVTVFMELNPDERDLIQVLVIDGMTERDYAAKIGLSQKGVNKRKVMILKKLRKSVLKP